MSNDERLDQLDYYTLLGVARDAGFPGPERGDEGLVHFLGEVVSLLVEAVDVALGAVDALETQVLAAGDVLGVPEGEIAEVVFLDEAREAIAGGGGGGLVPARRQGGLVGGNLGGGNHAAACGQRAGLGKPASAGPAGPVARRIFALSIRRVSS